MFGFPSHGLWFLGTLFELLVASILALFVIGRASVVTVHRGRAVAFFYLKRCVVAAVPLLLAVIVFVFAFFHDPLWPDQDETPQRHAVYLAAQDFVDRIYFASALLSAGGIFWFSRTAIAPVDTNSMVREM